MTPLTVIFIIGAIAVSAGCLAPAHWLPPLPNDKVLHFLAFGGLSSVAVSITHSSQQRLIALLAVFTGGLVIELLQIAVPGRQFCWRDLLANTGGIATAGILALMFT